MKKCKSFAKTKVEFTESHWMTSATNILYLRYLKAYYPKKKIGLVYDNAPSHISKEVAQFIEKENAKLDESERYVVEFIDPCLTSIYQPPDVALNKSLKQKIRLKYQEVISSRTDTLVAGDNIKVSREELVKMIMYTFSEINDDNKNTRSIANSFSLCGLNPYTDDSVFRQHLDRLELNGVYRSLTDQHTALELN